MITHILYGFGHHGVDGEFGEEGTVVVEFYEDVVGVWDVGVGDEVGEGVGREVAAVEEIFRACKLRSPWITWTEGKSKPLTWEEW